MTFFVMFQKKLLPYWVTAFIVLAAMAVLYLMGRVPICDCGYVKLWHGQTMSAESSQHLLDWYTPSHLLHGILFYAILFLLASKLTFGVGLAIATFVEAAWEILENTNSIIEHYRAVTISMDYFGDSVINSTTDILAMLVGFCLAKYIPVRLSIFTVVGFELLTLYVIRDGLTLNIVMFLYPLEAIKEWQTF